MISPNGLIAMMWQNWIESGRLLQMNVALENNEAAILSRVVGPENANLSREAAQSILGITFPENDRERMNELAEKARNGLLDTEEEAELDSYRHVGRLLEILKSKARLSLKKRAVAI